MQKYDQIIGPLTGSIYYSKEFNLLIYMFGDRHEHREKCKTYTNAIKIQDFIEQTINYNDDGIQKTEIDLFIEAGYIKEHPRLKGTECPLLDVRNKFQDCLEFSKTQCKYPNTRFHYVDMREFIQLHGVTNSKILKLQALFVVSFYILKLFENTSHKHLNDETFLKYITNIKNILEKNYIPSLNDLTNTDYFKDISKEIIKITKICKQRDNVKNKRILSVLDSHYSYYFINNNFINWRNLLLILENIKSFLHYIDVIPLNLIQLKEYIQKLNQHENLTEIKKMFEFYSKIMDFYLLYRLFREYSANSMSTNNNKAKNVIIVAGDIHITFYKEIFNDLKFDSITISQFGRQCLDITNIYQPLFGENTRQYYKLNVDSLNIKLLPYKIPSRWIYNIAVYMNLVSPEGFTKNKKSEYLQLINSYINSKNRKRVIECLKQLYFALVNISKISKN
jgi:hypothetical protein